MKYLYLMVYNVALLIFIAYMVTNVSPWWAIMVLGIQFPKEKKIVSGEKDEEQNE